MVLTDGGGVQGKAVGRPLLMTECTGDATGDLVLYLLGVMYRGALGMRLFLGLGVSGWGIFDGVVRGDVDTPVDKVIIDKSCGEVSLLELDTIKNVS